MYMPVGTGEQDVNLWNKGVTIRYLTNCLYLDFFGNTTAFNRNVAAMLSSSRDVLFSIIGLMNLAT